MKAHDPFGEKNGAPSLAETPQLEDWAPSTQPTSGRQGWLGRNTLEASRDWKAVERCKT